MTKIFAQVKSKTDEDYYSTYIEIDEKGEVIDWSCCCIGWAWFGQTKKNLEGMKPCIHILLLYKRTCLGMRKKLNPPETWRLHSKFEEIESYLNKHVFVNKCNQNKNVLTAEKQSGNSEKDAGIVLQ